MVWQQIYDPFASPVLSTLMAAVPVVVMLAALAFFHIKAHIAALLALGSALLILPMFVLGLDGLRRRTADYSNMDFRPLVIATAVGGFLIFLGLVVLFYNILRSRRKGAPAWDNPWEGRTLEWMTSSPPPYDNFPATPVVTGEPYDYGISSRPYADVTRSNPSKNR